MLFSLTLYVIFFYYNLRVTLTVWVRFTRQEIDYKRSYIRTYVAI